MKRVIGSNFFGSLQSPTMFTVAIPNDVMVQTTMRTKWIVFISTDIMGYTTIIDLLTGRYETATPLGKPETGRYYTVLPSDGSITSGAVFARYPLSGLECVIRSSQHGLNVLKPLIFMFSRREGEEWLYDVNFLEAKTNDSTGDITIYSNIDMTGMFLTIYK